jgi:hypothetical protein
MMETDFCHKLSRPQALNKQQRNAMAMELFDDPTELQADGVWASFNKAVNRLVDYSRVENMRLIDEQDSRLSRQDIYRDNFVVDGKGDNVALGRFKKPSADDPYILELKKYVDLVYNVNLPDRLGRYTFTPVHMPTRMALQDAPGRGYAHEQITSIVGNQDALEFLQRSFMSSTQNAMSLPLLKDLSVADIVHVRGLPEWEPFKDAQANILKNPLECIERMEDFQKKFDAFQRALCKWYNDKYERPKTEARYSTFVSLALSVGGKLIIAPSSSCRPTPS